MAATDALDTNLVRSKAGAKASENATPLDPGALAAARRKKLLKTLAYTIFFLWAFIFFTLLKIPDSLVTKCPSKYTDKATSADFATSQGDV